MMMFETVEDLGLSGLKIIQKKNGFRFGADAVLLADFSACKKGARVAELCSGSGIVSVLCAYHYDVKHIDAVEILPEYADMAARSVKLNQMSDVINVHCADLKDAPDFLGRACFDAVICNPPYKRASAGENCAAEDKAIARSEIKTDLDTVILTASKLLREKGSLFLVHRPYRLSDIIMSLTAHKMALKRLRLVCSHEGDAPTLILCEAKKNAASDVLVLPPLILYDKDGRETEETRKIYRRTENED